MKAKGRPEWNAMPGYTRAERAQSNHPTAEAALDALEIGIDHDTLREFLKEPTTAISRKIAQATSDLKGDMTQMEGWLKEHDDLYQLVLRLAPVLIFAERERAEKEEAK